MLLRNTGWLEGEGDVYTFLRVDINFPFAEPNLEGVEMLLEVEGVEEPETWNL
jgi:hypothetical protein